MTEPFVTRSAVTALAGRYGVSGTAGMGSSGVPHDAEDGEVGTRDLADGFRSRLTTFAIASMVSIP